MMALVYKKGSFYISNQSVGPLKALSLAALPGRPVHSGTNSASLGSMLAMQQLRATTKSLTFPLVTVYSQVLIYTAESTRASMERTKMPNLRNGSKGGFESGLI